MNKEFCISCGGRVLFEISKPKFCPECGQPFNTTLGSSSKRKQEPEEDSEFISGGFDLEKLRASITTESNKDKKSLDDLWKNPAPKDPNIYRPPSSDPSGEEILKKTMTECAQVKVAQEIGAPDNE